jgi:dihydrofolate synthase/folylpolyglutamate synthase
MATRLTTDRAALDALEALFARTTGTSRLGLERTTALLQRLGNPHRRYPTLHVAGTNGKGSVVAMLDAMLRVRPIRVGAYTSPHLVDFRERIRVNGAMVPGEYVVEFLRRWMLDIDRTGATFFEATTALAFAFFAAAEVDVAVIETGLGGRLDATNVIQPLVAGVTSIALDHMDYLGSTLEAIAAEKSGIFKRGVPAVIGDLAPTTRHLLANDAVARGAVPVRVVADEPLPRLTTVTCDGTRFVLERNGRERTYALALVGKFQAHNATTALAMLESAGDPWWPGDEAARAAIAGVRLAGRFQREGNLILDVAHNPDSIRALVETLSSGCLASPLVVVLTVLADKDWRAMMGLLARVVDRFVLTSAPTAPASRAWDPADAHAYATAQGWAATVEPDFDRALDAASASGATVLITGSFHTVGDAIVRLPRSSVTA